MNKKVYGVIIGTMNTSNEMLEKVERGKRIKNIRENELHMNKTQLGKLIGVSGQFLGLVEDGRGNLVYPNLKKLVKISGHSADYILFGLDDTLVENTKKLLDNYTDEQIIESIELIKKISIFMKHL